MSNRYFYLKTNRNSGRGVVCALLDLPGKGSVDPVKVSFSFCSPKDRFYKRVGRDNAKARLDSGNYVVVDNNNVGLYNLVLEAVSKASVPGWVSRSLKQGTLTKGLKEE
jgi:hypothetical protein